MSEKTFFSWAYCQADAHPSKKLCCDTAHSAVHSLAVADQSTWVDAYQALLQEAHKLCLMPHDPLVVKSLLRANDFVLQPGVKDRVTVEDICRYMNEHCVDGQIVLAVIIQGGIRTLVPIVPETHTKFTESRSSLFRYECLCPRYPTSGVQEVWVRWADRQDHSPIKRRKGRGLGVRHRKIPDDHEYFMFHQENPRNFTRDCSVRAMATTCDLDWHEAMDTMAKHNYYLCTGINTDSALRSTLAKEGFRVYRPLKENGRLLSGREFCRAMAQKFPYGEYRIYAYSGRAHVVAVMPFRDEEGKRCYRILDTSDSSGNSIGTFFVKDFTPPKVDQAPLDVNQRILHPIFGEGCIRAVPDPRWVHVSFSTGEKTLVTNWIREHCSLVQAA